MSETATSPRPPRGLLDRVFAPFDSVWLGIWLMAILFIYCSVGSAGIFRYTGGPLFSAESWMHVQLRADRGLEMTEYEWFHWWPFDVLIGLICVNLTVVTVRRIKLNAINAGVWMIHAGIIMLALGCVWYYSTKVEGDAPVVRGELVVTLPTDEQVRLPTVPGAQQRLRARDGGVWDLRVWQTDPQWALASAGDEGETAYSVMLEVQGPERRFLRQLIAGRPEYTEDLIFTDDRRQPMKRAVKVTGDKLVAPDLKVELEAPEARWFYLAHWIEKNWAIYVRERTHDDSGEWIQRPVEGLPLYNDYIGSHDDVWMPHARELPLDPIDVDVPSEDLADPLRDVDLNIDSYLRYARMEARRVEAGHGAAFDPVVEVLLDDGLGERFRYELAALDPERSTADGGFVEFVLIDGAEDTAQLLRNEVPRLDVRVGDDELIELPITDFSMRDPGMPWMVVGDTGYELRVEFVENELRITEGRTNAMASVEVRRPTEVEGRPREFRRWVFDDPRLNRDVTARGEDTGGDPHGGAGLDLPDGVVEPDPAIDIVYHQGHAPRPITVAAMADGELGVALNLVPGADGEWFPVELNEPVSLGRGATVTLTSYSAHASRQVRPYVVPPAERVRNMQHKQSMVRLNFRYDGNYHEVWVPFHDYPVKRPSENLRRYRYQPSRVELSDGRVLEFVLSRQRYLLPSAVKLDHFELAAHTGGFTGTTQSIRNWTSFVRFENDDGSYTEPLAVSVNQPVEHEGLSFFQAQWDPPSGQRFAGDVASSGLNYTVLGVGNRNGVMIQLIGTCISVLGMLYAFYYKPILIRRRKALRGGSSGGGMGARVGAPDVRPVAVSAPQDDLR